MKQPNFYLLSDIHDSLDFLRLARIKLVLEDIDKIRLDQVINDLDLIIKDLENLFKKLR
jgi:hypothetical protein